MLEPDACFVFLKATVFAEVLDHSLCTWKNKKIPRVLRKMWEYVDRHLMSASQYASLSVLPPCLEQAVGRLWAGCGNHVCILQLIQNKYIHLLMSFILASLA